MKACLALFALAVGLVSLPRLATAQQVHCDPNLSVPSNNPLAYKLRSDRCEGLFVQQVSGGLLRLVAFAESFEEYDFDGSPLLVEWSDFESGELHLRAQSLQRRVYYRMDSARPASSGEYVWPTDILAALNLTRSDVGMLAWTMEPWGEATRLVYNPLRIRQSRPYANTDEYEIVFVPDRELRQVYVSLMRLEPDGAIAETLMDSEELSFGYYPAGRPVRFRLSPVNANGTYRVSLGATLRSGGSGTLEFLFNRQVP